jgi:DNA-binding Lrp family transcriptional regulator
MSIYAVMKQKDEAIIALLRKNSRLSVTEISQILEIPDTTIHYRLKKLNDIIKKYTILLDYTALGLTLYLLRMEIERYVLEKVTTEIIENIYNALSKREGIVGIFKSRENIFVIIAVEELQENEFRYPGVKTVESFVLDSYEIL